MDLMSKRYYYFLLSAIIIVPGIIAMIVWGLQFSNEFTGGSLLEVKFDSGNSPPASEVASVYASLGYPDTQISTSGSDVLIIRSGLLPEGVNNQIVTELQNKFNQNVTVLSFENIGPELALEVTNRGILVVLLAAAAVAIYITVIFRGVPNSFRYGMCTVAALVHDVLVMLSVAAITGHFLGWQVDTLFLTALLTVIAFSAQDTIVLFDRVRENIGIFKRLNFNSLVNHSVIQTLTRSINTQIMAVDFLLLSLALFGGASLQRFAVYLLVGMLSGSYSSEFNAAPLLIVWQNREWRHWFRREEVSPYAS